LSGDINLDYDDSIASLPISSLALGLLAPYKVFIKKSQRKGMVTVVIVCMCSRDKVKAKSLLAGEIVVILNQNILMINRKCIKRAKTCFLQRRCRKTERTKVPSWRINTRDRN
jgi:hypothetical protein